MPIYGFLTSLLKTRAADSYWLVPIRAFLTPMSKLSIHLEVPLWSLDFRIITSVLDGAFGRCTEVAGVRKCGTQGSEWRHVKGPGAIIVLPGQLYRPL